MAVLAYAIVFLMITIICALFGFVGIGVASFAAVARILFFVFLLAFLASMVVYAARRAH